MRILKDYKLYLLIFIVNSILLSYEAIQFNGLALFIGVGSAMMLLIRLTKEFKGE